MYSTKYSADGKRHTKLRCSALSDLRLSLKSSFNRSSSPHRKGGFRPAGGGTCLPMVRKKSPRKLSGVQLAIPILPPGLSTRRSSLATFSWLGANIAPSVESTTSKELSGKGRSSASPSRKSTCHPSARALSLPPSSREGT